MLKPLTMWITTNCKKFVKRWKYQTALPAFWEMCMQVKKQLLEPDMEQWTRSKWGKYAKAVYRHPAYLIYTQSTSCEMLGWMKHKLESRLPGKISITLDIQITPLSWQRRWTKVPLDEFDRGEGKSWLKTQYWKKRRSWHLVPSLMANRWGNETGRDFIFLGSKNHCRWWL